MAGDGLGGDHGAEGPRPGGPRGLPHHKGRGLGARRPGAKSQTRSLRTETQRWVCDELQPAPPQPALPLGFQENPQWPHVPVASAPGPLEGLGGGLPPLRRMAGGLDRGSHPVSIGRPTPYSAGLGHCSLRAGASACCGSVGEDTGRRAGGHPAVGPGVSFIDVSAGREGAGRAWAQAARCVPRPC